MDPDASAFVEDCGLLMADAGLPRSVGRVLGLLLICEPEHQSAEAIRTQLQLSAGSVSTAVGTLRKLNLVSTKSFAGDRRLYYLIDPEYEQKILTLRVEQIRRGIRLADAGLKLTPDNPRLLNLRHIYAEFDQILAKIKPRQR